MAVATTFSDVMTQLTGNAGGAIQSLPAVTLNGSRSRKIIASIVLASQASGSVIGVARIPVGAAITDIQLTTDTSLGSATISLGDSNSGAIYMAAQTFTATDTPTAVGKTATRGVPIAAGYDCVTGKVTTPPAGGNYEDVVLTVGTASLPSSGNLRIIIEYALD